MSTKNLAIMFTDIQGFTARTSASTREGIEHLLDAHDKLLKPVFATFRGNIVKTIGDAFLVWFESPTDAVICGLTIQEVLRQRNEKVAEGEKLHVRVAINAGDVELRTEPTTGALDVFGEAVNLAARLEGITEAGEVWFTEAVYLTMNRAEAPSTEIGERTFKGIPNPVRVYKVIYEPGSEQALALAARVVFTGDGRTKISREVPVLTTLGARTPRRTTRWVAAAGILGVLALAALAISWRSKHPGIRATLSRAKKMVQEHRDADALEALGAVDPVPAVRDLARIALADELAARATKKEPARVTLAWMNDLLARHPKLSAVRDAVPPIETAAFVEKLLKNVHGESVDEDSFWKPLRDQLDKYPDDRDVHFAAATTITRSGEFVPEFGLWLYVEAFKRGAHKPDFEFFRLLTEILKDGAPTETVRTEARARIVANFRTEGADWARQVIDFGSEPYEFLNARALLQDLKDPAGDRADTTALANMLLGIDMPAARKTLLADKVPAHRTHAHAVLEKASDHYSYPKANKLDCDALLPALH